MNKVYDLKDILLQSLRLNIKQIMYSFLMSIFCLSLAYIVFVSFVPSLIFEVSALFVIVLGLSLVNVRKDIKHISEMYEYVSNLNKSD